VINCHVALSSSDRDLVDEQFSALVNMSPDQLRDWLKSAESKSVGWKGANGTLDESVGHASGRRIVEILEKARASLTDDDLQHMRRTIGFIRRHSAQEPSDPVLSRWRYSLMNWGHDPLKKF
jgi:hypothetical protein